METELYIGTPGNSDGVMRYWLDGNLVGEALNRPLIASGNSMNVVYFYLERGIGDLYYDDVAVGDGRLGCSGSSTTTDQPPGPPLSPRIQSVTAN
jgi:hypothetical protein